MGWKPQSINSCDRAACKGLCPHNPYNPGCKGTGKEKIGKVMHKFKKGKLHSGSKKGPIVKDRDQAIAIGFSEAEDEE